MCARRFLDLPRVVVLGVRRGVHHHVARLNLSRFFRLRGLPRGWENSYLGGSCGERSGTTHGIIGAILIRQGPSSHPSCNKSRKIRFQWKKGKPMHRQAVALFHLRL